MNEYEMVIKQYEEYLTSNKKTAINRISNFICKKYSGQELLQFGAYLLESQISESMQIITMCIKKDELAYNLDYINYYYTWIYKYVNSWGTCDLLCYRVINPMIEKFPSLYFNIKKWANNSNPFIRRLSAVSLIHSSQAFSIEVPFSLVIEVIDELKYDTNYYVKKGIGWLLKYSYLSYRKETIEYILNNKEVLPNTVITYALQKMTNKDKYLIKGI